MALEFEYEPRGFDLDNAFWFAKACQAAAQDDAEKVTEQAGEPLGLEPDSVESFAVVDPDGLADYHGFVAANENMTVLAFRDAVSLDPWLTDSTIVQKAAYGGMVHKGFADALDQVWEEVDPLLDEYLTKKNLWLTGHGLGGALALLAAARLDAAGTTCKGVCTFGAPRVGDSDFFASFEVPAYRLVNNNDVIAHVPAEHFPVGGYHWVSYKHVGTLIYFDRHGNVGEGTSQWSRKKELMQQQLQNVSQPPTSWFQDHLLGSYLTVIEQNL